MMNDEGELLKLFFEKSCKFFHHSAFIIHHSFFVPPAAGGKKGGINGPAAAGESGKGETTAH
jgi:hypothetical protein